MNDDELRQLPFESAIAPIERHCQYLAAKFADYKEKPEDLNAINRRDAWVAMQFLDVLPVVRRALAETNAPLAATGAYIAGRLEGILHIEEDKLRQRKIGRATGRKGGRPPGVSEVELKKIERLLKSWLVSDELQSSYRSPTSYIVEKTKLPERKVRRRLEKLKDSDKKGR